MNEAGIAGGDDKKNPHLEDELPSGETVDTVLATTSPKMTHMKVRAYMPELEQKNVEMLLDSGAGVNVVPEEWILKTLRHEIDRKRKMTSIGFNGSTQSSEGVFLHQNLCWRLQDVDVFCRGSKCETAVVGLPWFTHIEDIDRFFKAGNKTR